MMRIPSGRKLGHKALLQRPLHTWTHELVIQPNLALANYDALFMDPDYYVAFKAKT